MDSASTERRSGPSKPPQDLRLRLKVGWGRRVLGGAVLDPAVGCRVVVEGPSLGVLEDGRGLAIGILAPDRGLLGQEVTGARTSGREDERGELFHRAEPFVEVALPRRG